MTTELQPGDLVRYYHEAWYTGYLVSTNGFTATVKPIKATKGKQGRDIKVPADAVEFISRADAAK